MIIIIVIIRSYYIDHKSSSTTSPSLSRELHLKNLIFLFISGSNKEEARDSKTEARTTQ